MNDRPIVALVGSLDTKGEEYAFARDAIREHKADAVLIDVGVLGEPTVRPDIAASEVAKAASNDVVSLRSTGDRGVAMQAMADGAATIVAGLRGERDLKGVLALGGSNAAYVLSVVAARLPVGFPKLLVSTMAAGDTRGYVGETDLTLMYPVVDINGLNRVSRAVIRNAAAAIAGMAHGYTDDPGESAPVVAISMMGVTTTVAMAVAERLGAAGIETLSFHTTGTGGRTMESLSGVDSSLVSPISRRRSLPTNSSVAFARRVPSGLLRLALRGSLKW